MNTIRDIEFGRFAQIIDPAHHFARQTFVKERRRQHCIQRHHDARIARHDQPFTGDGLDNEFVGSKGYRDGRRWTGDG